MNNDTACLTLDFAAQTFLVIGCGSIGKRHMRNLRLLGAGNIVGFDPWKERREEARSQTGADVVDRLEEAWQREPQIVVIASPTSLHVPMALEAARRGCHLFIEKPISNTVDGIEELLAEVANRCLVTLVGCNLRFHPCIAHIKQLLQQNAVGTITAGMAQVGQYLPDWHPWEDYRLTYSARRELGGGIILDAIHEIDYMRWLLGEVDAVACFAGKASSLEMDVEDTAAILFRMKSGAVAELHLDYIQRAHSRTCRIIGEGGTIDWDDRAPEVRHYSAVSHQWKTFHVPEGWEDNLTYIEEMRHFLCCIRSLEKPMLDAQEAYRVLRLALAAKESSAKSRVIDVSAA